MEIVTIRRRHARAPFWERTPHPPSPLMPLRSPSMPTGGQRHIAAPDTAVPISATLPGANTASSPRTVAGRSPLGTRYRVLDVHSLGTGGSGLGWQTGLG